MNKKLAKRILDISYTHKLAHLGSCLSVLPILEEIYDKKKSGDKVFLSGAHSHLAHLVVREEYEELEDIEGLLGTYGIHCDTRAGCDSSGGSLGHLGIAVGMAIANPNITVYAIITDGSLMEGSEMEALRIFKDRGINNLEIYCNFNNYTAVERYIPWMIDSLEGFLNIRETDNGIPLLKGVQGHYLVLNEETYNQGIKELEAL